MAVEKELKYEGKESKVRVAAREKYGWGDLDGEVFVDVVSLFEMVFSQQMSFEDAKAKMLDLKAQGFGDVMSEARDHFMKLHMDWGAFLWSGHGEEDSEYMKKAFLCFVNFPNVG